MKMYLSKYALSKGIIEFDYIDSRVYGAGKYFMPIGYHELYRIGDDIHREKEDAVRVAMRMRLKKIKLLKKQIEKLEKMTFA